MSKSVKSSILLLASMVIIVIYCLAIILDGLEINRVIPIIISILIIILSKRMKNLYPLAALFGILGIIGNHPGTMIIYGCGLISSFMKSDDEDNLKTFIKKNPLLSSIVIGISGLSLVSFSALISFSTDYYFGPEMLAELGACIGLSIIIFICHKYRFIINNEVTFFQMIKISLPVWIFMMISFTVQFLTNIYTSELESSTFIIILIITYLLVGLFEEFLLRGLVLNILLDKYKNSRKNIWFAIVVSSLIFGLAHYMNLSTGASFFGVTMQVVSATAMGIYLAAIYLRTGNIWYNSLIHGLWDVIASISFIFIGNELDYGEVISAYDLPMLVPAVFYIIFALFLLRKKKIKNVINRLNNRELEKEEVNRSVLSVQRIFAITAVVFSFVIVFGLIFDFRRIDQLVKSTINDIPKYYDSNNYIFTDNFKDEDLTDDIKLYMAAYMAKDKDINNATFTISDNDIENSYKDLFNKEISNWIDFSYSKNYNCTHSNEEYICNYFNYYQENNIKAYTGIKEYTNDGNNIEVELYYFIYDLDNKKVYGDSSLENLIYSGNIIDILAKYNENDQYNKEFFNEISIYFEVPVYKLKFKTTSTLQSLEYKGISTDKKDLVLNIEYDSNLFERKDYNNKTVIKKDDNNYLEIRSVSQTEYLDNIIDSSIVYIQNNKYYYNSFNETYLINDRYNYYMITMKNDDYVISDKLLDILKNLSI